MGSYTNEELAQLIQSGHTEYYAQLWQQTHKFFRKCASQQFRRFSERLTKAGVEFDDVMQACFLALVDAVQAFDSSTGFKLITYCNYPLKKRFRELRSNRSKEEDVLTHSASLDAPYGGDDENDTLGDMFVDRTAATIEEETEEESSNADIKAAVAALDSPYRELIERHYFNNELFTDIEKSLGMFRGKSTQCHRKALQQLKNDERMQAAADAKRRVAAKAYSGVSFRSFAERRASNPEWLTELLDDIERRAI